MASITLYYSLGGSTRAEAEKRAAETGSELCELREAKKRNPFTAFLPGCPQAMHRKAVKLLPLQKDLSAFDTFILCCPVWAGFPAPAFNSALSLLPKGAKIQVVLCSGGGETPKSKESTLALLRERGFEPISYEDVRTALERQ